MLIEWDVINIKPVKKPGHGHWWKNRLIGHLPKLGSRPDSPGPWVLSFGKGSSLECSIFYRRNVNVINHVQLRSMKMISLEFHLWESFQDLTMFNEDVIKMVHNHVNSTHKILLNIGFTNG